MLKNNQLVNKDKFMALIYDLVSNQSKDVRKKATNCLGQFSVILTQAQLQKLMAIITDRLNK